jgi:hypothetical protein
MGDQSPMSAVHFNILYEIKRLLILAVAFPFLEK